MRKSAVFNKKLAVNSIVVAILAVVTVAIGVCFGVINEIKESDGMFRNVSINGINLNGLTYAQAKKQVEEKISESFESIKIQLVCEGNTVTLNAQQLGITTDFETVFKQAQSKSEDDKTFSFMDIEKFNNSVGKGSGENFTTQTFVDKNILMSTVKQYAEANYTKPKDADAIYDAKTDTFEYTDEEMGKKVKEDEVVAQIESQINKQDYSPIYVTRTVVQPQVHTVTVKDNTKAIGVCETKVYDNKNRNVNIEIMCRAIDGIKVDPGQELSLNGVVGERTKEAGFLPAPSIIDGSVENSVGGGICQLAGTLYNAAILADMEIVERQRHSFPSDYLPVGLDAVLSYPNKDLKIKNTSEYPIYISAKMTEEVVRVKIYGQPLPSNVELKIRTDIEEEVKPGNPSITYTRDLPPGVRKVQEPARTGYKVHVFRDYMENGNVVRSEELSYDYYLPVEAKILQGSDTNK